MRFRTRLLLIFTVAIVASVAVVDLLVLGSTRQAFERSETERADALVLQFRKEFDRRRRELVRTVNAIAASEAAHKIAIRPDTTEYYDYAAPQAATHDLDLLELVAADGAIVSSAQWPARFGYKDEWLTTGEDWKLRGAFLRREELPQGVTLALVAVGTATEGDRKLYVVGGLQLDREFLQIDELGPPRRPLGTVKLVGQILGDALEVRRLSGDLRPRGRLRRGASAISSKHARRAPGSSRPGLSARPPDASPTKVPSATTTAGTRRWSRRNRFALR